MNANFCCPKCKGSIVTKADGYLCQNCVSFYSLRDGYVDFMGDVEFYAGEISQQEIQKLIEDIDLRGYDDGLTLFFKSNPHLQDYITDIKRADWVCHCLGKNNLRCLDIGSGLGNISEILSYTYQQVYSVEAVRERIEFQKRRYKKFQTIEHHHSKEQWLRTSVSGQLLRSRNMQRRAGVDRSDERKRPST